MVRELIRQNPMVIRWVKNPEKEILEYAIRVNPVVIRELHNLSDELKLLAIKLNPLSIRYIDKPSTEMVETAMKKDYRAIRYIPDEYKTEDIIKLIRFKKNYDGYLLLHIPINHITEAMTVTALQINPEMFEDLPSIYKTLYVCREVVRFRPKNLMFVPEEYLTDYTLQKNAVEQDGMMIKCIANQTEGLCLRAVKNNPEAFRYVNPKYQTVDMAKYAVSKHKYLYKYVSFISDEVIAIYENKKKYRGTLKIPKSVL